MGNGGQVVLGVLAGVVMTGLAHIVGLVPPDSATERPIPPGGLLRQVEELERQLVHLQGTQVADLQLAVAKLQASAVPVGTILAFSGSEALLPPSGDWLPCDGRTLIASDYPELARVLTGSPVNAAVPSGNIKLPNLQHQFLRGAGNGRLPLDQQRESLNRQIQSHASDVTSAFHGLSEQFRTHRHYLFTFAAYPASNGVPLLNQNAGGLDVLQNRPDWFVSALHARGADTLRYALMATPNHPPSGGRSSQPIGATRHAIPALPESLFSDEIRPTNVAVLFFIKVK